jgi:hypothetical protein
MTPLLFEVVAAEIRHVESAPVSQAVGRAGELGPYQFTLAVWRQHTTLPFAYANDPRIASQIAVKHVTWLGQHLVKHGFEASPYNLALAWNAGLTATVRQQLKPRHRDYAQRVSNLVAERLGQRP